MNENKPQDKWFNRIIKMVSKQNAVTVYEVEDGEFLIKFFHKGTCHKHTLIRQKINYAYQKNQYSDLRKMLMSIGIKEGAVYIPPPPKKRGSTPEIRKARSKHRKEFEGWQEILKNIRAAEKDLEVNFELKQMIDYY